MSSLDSMSKFSQYILELPNTMLEAPIEIDPTSVAIALGALTLGSVGVARELRRKQFPSAIPFPLNQSVLTEIVYLIGHQKAKGYKFILDEFLRESRKKLGTIFYGGRLFAGNLPGPVLFITHPEDQAAILKKERQLEWFVNMPDTAIAIHGPENFQSLPNGKKHSILRKVYSSILSPKALEAFTTEMVKNFTELWHSLDTANYDNDDTKQVKLTLVIKEAQLKLMCNILYGFDFTKEDDKQILKNFLADFHLTEKSLFAPSKKSEEFIDGFEARKRISTIINQRFDSIFQARLKQVHSGSEENKEEHRVGSAMQQIADALIENGCTGPDSSSSDNQLSYSAARENLYLLLEASHGTTMYTTSALMYFLNHSNNRNSLEQLRKEVLSISSPTYANLKNFAFGDACIKEAMRLAPIAGNIGYYVPKGKTFEVKGTSIDSPVTLMFASSHWYTDNDVFVKAESFIPERFLDNGSPYKASEFAKSTFRPFGFGRHICLGYPLATLVMKANLYCFAMKDDRAIEFDEKTVKIVENIFPMKKVDDDFPCRIITE